jgi:glycosyltransferase involved in cell wall biosynthesis
MDVNPRLMELEGSGVQVIVDKKRWKFDLSLLRRLRKFIREFRADIVQGFLFDGDFYARIAVAGTGIPALSSERSDNYQLSTQQSIALLLTRHLAAGVVANTHAGASFARNLLRLQVANSHVVWNGLDIATIDRRLANVVSNVRKDFFAGADVKVACLVGMLRPEKDYLLALQVAKELTQSDASWCVLFVGDSLPQTSNYKAEVMRAFESGEFSGRVAFAGLRQDVTNVIAQCDVLFCTSLHEGFPNVVLEAMTVGTPVVSTDYSDITMILPERWQVIGGRDPVGMACAIQRAEKEHEYLSAKQREWIEANATLSRASSQLEEIYAKYIVQKNECRLQRS